MSWIDWLIVIIPTAFVMFLGMYSRKYVHSVADFLSAGRCARRYVLSMGDVANALAVTGLVAYVEVHYKTGFAIAFWNSLIAPLTIAMGLYGYCTYRFRETRAMSLGQFLEMRYNRKFRIFACALRSISEMLANMIMPAVAARFFIYFLDLPHSIIICADHTHTGPEYGNPGAADKRTCYAFNAAADAAMRALTRAVMNLQPGEIEIGSVYNNPYGFIRRYWMKDGTIVTNPGWRSGVSGVAPGFAPEALP